MAKSTIERTEEWKDKSSKSSSINVRYKDGIFRYIFNDNKEFKELYETLTGNKLDCEIRKYDTSNLMSQQNFRNDVSFMTDDGRLVVLLEHQSSQNENMALRQFLYYAKIVEIYLRDEGKITMLHQNKLVKIPRPEFIVAYNGKETLKKVSYSLSDNFIDKGVDWDMSTRVYDINYSRLTPKQVEQHNSLIGYSYFVERVEFYKRNMFLDVGSAIKNASIDCKESGYLVEYLDRKEFVTMATEYLSQEDLLNIKRNEGIEEGIEKNRSEMVMNMLNDGMKYENISKYAGISIDDVKQIEKSLNSRKSENKVQKDNKSIER